MPKEYQPPSVTKEFEYFPKSFEFLVRDVDIALKEFEAGVDGGSKDSFEPVCHPKLIVFEGRDGSGKTSLMLNVAQKLHQQGQKVIFMKGSGTGIEDQMQYFRGMIDGDDRAIAQSQYEQIEAALAEYKVKRESNEGDWEDLYFKSYDKWIEYHFLMQNAITKFLEKGYIVLSDRGWGSYILGSQERAFLNAMIIMAEYELPNQKVQPYFPKPGNHILLDVDYPEPEIRVLARIPGNVSEIPVKTIQDIFSEGAERTRRYELLYQQTQEHPLMQMRKVKGGSYDRGIFKPRSPDEMANEILEMIDLSGDPYVPEEYRKSPDAISQY
jgi:thymidylate kinase